MAVTRNRPQLSDFHFHSKHKSGWAGYCLGWAQHPPEIIQGSPLFPEALPAPAQHRQGWGSVCPLSSSSRKGLPGGAVSLRGGCGSPRTCRPLSQMVEWPFTCPAFRPPSVHPSIAPPQRGSPLLSRAVLPAVRYPTGELPKWPPAQSSYHLASNAPLTWEGQPSFFFTSPGSRNTEFQTFEIRVCILVRLLEIRKPCSLTFLTSRSWWRAPPAFLTQ